MKSIFVGIVLLGLAGLCLPACGGRANLSEDSGFIYKRTMNLQATSRPRYPLAPLAATDAKIIVRNHEATNAMGGKAGGGRKGTKQKGASKLSVGGTAR